MPPRRAGRRWTTAGRADAAAGRRAGRATRVRPTLHTFAAHDGLPLTGWLFRPRGAPARTHPAVAARRPGGAGAAGVQPLFQSLVDRGHRGVRAERARLVGFGRTSPTPTTCDRRFAAITDVRAAVEYLVSAGAGRPGPDRVPGRSYGGYLTLAALARFPELFAVGIDVCGISDFATFYAHTEPWIAAAAVTKYGDPVDRRRAAARPVPDHQVDRITAPLMVVHGANDSNVPLVEAEQVVAALTERGAAPGFLLFPDEGHEVHGTENRAVFVREVVRWVTAQLLELGVQTA